MKILSLITLPHVIPNLEPSFIFRTQIKIFLMKSKSFLTLRDSNATATFKAQKGSEDIVKIIHVTSVVRNFMRIIFVCKENKINDFIQQFPLFRVSLTRAFTRVPRRMRVVQAPAFILVYRLYILIQISKAGKNCKSSFLLKSSDIFTNTFFLFYVQCASSSAYKQGTVHPGSTSEHRVLC